MSRGVGLAQITRQDDGAAIGVWGLHTLRSAFQPIFAFEEGRLVAAAYEGLLRPFRDGAPVGAGAFFSSIPAADRNQVETLARALHFLNAQCLDETALLFVNFDPSHFDGAGAVDGALEDIRLVLDEAEIQPSRIMCEITEQKLHTESELLRFVRHLREFGYQVAVDDYGAEDSDMRRILDLKPDVVKFDGLWVNQLMETEPGRSLLFEMVRRFRGMGIRTVFEGIEEGWQLEFAETAGVNMVQGFVLARPELAPARFELFRRDRPDGQAAATSASSMVVGPMPAGSPAETRAVPPPRQRRQKYAFGKRVH